MKKFEDLTEREVLALAIGLEEEDERVYADFAEGMRQDFPATAAMFDGMREEESGHRRRLIELYQLKFGEHIPLIRRFYEKSAARTEDASIRQLLNDLAQEERSHEHRAEEIGKGNLDPAAKS